MSLKDREQVAKSAGHPNAGMTADECREKNMKRDERTAQREIANYLRLKNIEFINPPMNRKSTLPVGWPDFTFAVERQAVGLEVKVWGQKLRPEQVDRHRKLAENGWVLQVVSGVAEVSELVKKLEKL